MASDKPGFPWSTLSSAVQGGAMGTVDSLRGLGAPGNTAKAYQQARDLFGAALEPQRTFDSIARLARVTAEEGRRGELNAPITAVRIGGDMAGAAAATFAVTTAVTVPLGAAYLATPPGVRSLAHTTRFVAQFPSLPANMQRFAARTLAKTPVGLAVGGAITAALWVGGASERETTARANRDNHRGQASALEGSGLEAALASKIALIEKQPPK